MTAGRKTESHLLMAQYTYYQCCRYRCDSSRATWPIVKALITFGDKYDVAEFRRDGISILQASFPSGIVAWDRTRKSNGTGWEKEKGMAFAWVETIDMASVTRTLGDPRLHAAVLYQCCSLPITDLVKVCNEDATLSLSPEDLQRCLKMRERLPEIWADLSGKAFDTLLDNCPARCKEKAIRVDVLDWVTVNMKPTITCDVLDPNIWTSLFGDAADDGLCAACVEFCRERHTELRQDILDDLPNLWNDLPEEEDEEGEEE